ncbi:GTPase Obg [compost metagenome]
MVVKEQEPDATVAKEDGVWQVRQPRLERFIANMNPESADAITTLHKILDEFGVIDRLREMGVEDGDTVAIGEFEFDFVE